MSGAVVFAGSTIVALTAVPLSLSISASPAFSFQAGLSFDAHVVAQCKAKKEKTEKARKEMAQKQIAGS